MNKELVGEMKGTGEATGPATGRFIWSYYSYLYKNLFEVHNSE
jgi:hypothetical protein